MLTEPEECIYQGWSMLDLAPRIDPGGEMFCIKQRKGQSNSGTEHMARRGRIAAIGVYMEGVGVDVLGISCPIDQSLPHLGDQSNG